MAWSQTCSNHVQPWEDSTKSSLKVSSRLQAVTCCVDIGVVYFSRTNEADHCRSHHLMSPQGRKDVKATETLQTSDQDEMVLKPFTVLKLGWKFEEGSGGNSSDMPRPERVWMMNAGNHLLRHRTAAFLSTSLFVCRCCFSSACNNTSKRVATYTHYGLDNSRHPGRVAAQLCQARTVIISLGSHHNLGLGAQGCCLHHCWCYPRCYRRRNLLLHIRVCSYAARP